MQCIKSHTGYCNGGVEQTRFGHVCEYHEFCFIRSEPKDSKRKSDDDYGLQLYDNDLFGVMAEQE